MTPAQPSLSHPRYRRDIDGLRAIAVLAVVAFHAYPNLFRAGFIGVDVFFVISGFLISTIILENLERGSFSFAGFYARRVKRIFPALILVLLACFAFGWFVLLPDEYKQLGKHTAGGAGFVSNLVLWNEAGYFDNSAETKPLLHLWSLGIEEQFYIAWPLLVFLAWKRKFNLLAMTAIVAAISFACNVVQVGQDSVAAFYSPLPRFWELLCGGLLAEFALRRAKVREGTAVEDNFIVANGASVLGFALLAWGFLHIGRDMGFPGVWALLPVLGAAAILYAGPRALLNRFVLANPILVWFGLISYPLYLWHWPLLSYARIIDGGYPGRNAKVGAVLAAIVLAWLTYRLIERPIRFGKRGRATIVVLAVLMACVGVMGYSAYCLDGLRDRAAVSANKTVALSGYDGGDGDHLTGDCGLPYAQRKLFGVCGSDNRGHVKYALLGDSKAQAFYTGLIRTSTNAGRWLVVGGNGANGALVPVISPEPEYAQYQKLAGIAIDAVANNKDIQDVVYVVAVRALFQLDDGVRGANLSGYDYKYLRQLNASNKFDIAHAGLTASISRFAAAGKKVVIVVDNPALPEARDCIGRKTSSSILNKGLGLENRGANQDCFLPLADYDAETTLYKKLLGTLQNEFPGTLTIFDATDVYCDRDKNVCGPTRDGHFLYAYTDHVSDFAAGLAGAKLNAYLNK